MLKQVALQLGISLSKVPLFASLAHTLPIKATSGLGPYIGTFNVSQ
jgi:hypothetical protein